MWRQRGARGCELSAILFLRECLWGRPWNLSRIKENEDMGGWEGQCGENAAGPSTGSLKEDEGLLGSKCRDKELEGECG